MLCLHIFIAAYSLKKCFTKVGMVSLHKYYVNYYPSYGKSWLEKLWQIYGHLPNSPIFPPTKVSLHTVAIGEILKLKLFNVITICRVGSLVPTVVCIYEMSVANYKSTIY